MTFTNDELEVFDALLSYKKPFDIKEFCFDKQLSFIQDEASFKVAVCSRRAGKTVACAAHLIHTALAAPKQVCLYITLSRNNAKKIIWGDLTTINRDYELGARTNDTELSLTFPNGSVIYLSGAKDKSEIEKFRGLAITLCYIDECQSFRNYIRELVDDVISKALFDYNGTLCLIGTPGPVPAGYFYDCYSSPEWSAHGWTFFDNPWIERKSGKTHRELLERELKRKGVTAEDPSIQREVFGKWTVDYESLVFKYDKNKNSYRHLPQFPGSWEYVFGIDLGFDDSDAIAVLGWNPKSPSLYLIEEWVRPKQGITALAVQVERLIQKYQPNAIVMDTGGLGKKIAEELNHRFGLPIKAAEKARKFEYIELLNDSLRTQKFHVEHSSRFAQDAMLVEWDKDVENPERLKISDKFHSDICDAVLYAFREAMHWLHTPEVIRPKFGSKEHFEEEERKLEEAAFERMKKTGTTADEDFLFGNRLNSDEDWD